MNYLLTGDVWALHEEFLCEIYRCHTHQNTEGISLFCALCTYCTTMQAEIRGNFRRFWACELMCRNNFTLCGCILFFLKLWKIPAGEIQVCECVEKIGCGRIKCKKITSMVMLHKGLLLRTFEYRFKVENWSYTCIHMFKLKVQILVLISTVKARPKTIFSIENHILFTHSHISSFNYKCFVHIHKLEFFLFRKGQPKALKLFLISISQAQHLTDPYLNFIWLIL